MSGHTPGPWAAFTVHSASVNPYCAYLIAGPKTRIMDRTVGFTREDAYLIAAAPDLLEALEELFADYKQLADSGDAGFWRLEDQEAGKKALAAIARAKGEA